MSKAKIARLKEEVESIQFADVLYWKRGKDYSREARAEYQHRQNRLQEIRSELAQAAASTNGEVNSTPPMPRLFDIEQ